MSDEEGISSGMTVRSTIVNDDNPRPPLKQLDAMYPKQLEAHLQSQTKFTMI